MDFGASDHMIGNATLFHQYKPSKAKNLVRIANGSLSKLKVSRTVRITKDLILNSVLYVPNLDCNLLSISKLTRDLKCEAKFFPFMYEFQELESGKKIDSVDLCSGIYLLEGDPSLRKHTQNAISWKSNQIFNTIKIVKLCYCTID